MGNWLSSVMGNCSSSVMGNWSDLPLDILCEFVKRLVLVEEMARFGGVCRSWRQATIQEKKKTPGRLSAWLMLAKIENDDPSSETGMIRRCYSLSTQEFFHLRLPQLQGRRCWGTKYGWLFTFGLDGDIFLFNPLTQAKISLPSHLKFVPPLNRYRSREHMCTAFAGKFDLSSDPSDSSTHPPMVLITHGGIRQLSFAYPGDENWTFVSTPSSIQNVVFYQSRFFCISGAGVLRVCHTDVTTGPCTKDVASRPNSRYFDLTGTSYLVDISGGLYLVNRSYEFRKHKKLYSVTKSFHAFKFDFHEKTWSGCLPHLEGHALFLGDNPSFAISPLDYPQFKPNCIYYTDDYPGCYGSGYLDMGIYDYETHTVVGSFDNCVDEPSVFSRPVFFTPLQPNLP